MTNIHVYHLDLCRNDIQGAEIVLLPGDPFRVAEIAQEIERQYGGQSREITWKREYRTYKCSVHGRAILVTSTGIGGPSTAIAIEELALLGLKIFVRVGTTGAIQEFICPGDVIITTGSVRLDGTSTHYAPIEYPAVADPHVVTALMKGSEKAKVAYHTGITVSSDTFYPGQERYDSFSKYVLRRFQGSMKEWQQLHVLNYEMESSTVLTLTSAMGLKGGCITGVVINRMSDEGVSIDALEIAERNAIEASVASVEELL